VTNEAIFRLLEALDKRRRTKLPEELSLELVEARAGAKRSDKIDHAARFGRPGQHAVHGDP
jgi:hypothetical protein